MSDSFPLFLIDLNQLMIGLRYNHHHYHVRERNTTQQAIDAYNTWTFPDHLRADTKGDLKIDSKQLTLTGMALGLNSALTIPEFKKKLPPCPMLLLSNSEGVLLVYYFLHQQLQFACHAPEVIKPIQAGNIFGSAAPTSSLALTGTFSSSQPPTNGFQMTQLNSTAALSRIPIASQGKEKTNLTSAFNFTQAPPQIANGSPFSEISKTPTMNLGSEPTRTQKQSPIKSTVSQEQPSTPKVDTKNLFQTIDQFQSKLNTLTNSLPKASTSSGDFDKSLENLTKTLQDMNNTFEKSSQSVKTMTHEHIEYMTKIENARYQLRSSLKENLYHSLKDRELDPWTQARLDSIKTKYDQLKHDLDVLLQVTHATIRDRSAPDTSEDAENEDFLPDLEISLITTGTMKQRLRNRIRELSHKVSQTESDLQQICAKLNTDILSSKTFDKTTMSSERPFHNTDAQILAHLQATHKTITQVRVPLAVGINLSSTVESTKKQPVNEAPKVTTPSIQPSTPHQSSSPTVDSESFKNMLRLVRTSIDLFSGVTSPEQLQELSNTIATSPLSAAPKSNTTPISKTPTTAKATTLTKTATLPKTLQTTTALQTPAKSTTSAPPAISVTPATPATQTFASNVPLSFSQVKPTIVSAATDLTKPQVAATSGDNAIRSLLNSTVSPSLNTASVTKPLANTTTPNQVALSSSFGVSSLFNQPGTSSPSTTTITSLSSTITTSVQSTSPTVKPLTSSGAGAFGSKPALGGSSSLNLGSLSASISFDNSSSVTPLATTISTPSPSGTVFGTPSSTAPTSTATTGPFGGSIMTPVTTSASTGSAFGSLSGPFGATVAIATTAPTSGLFSTPTTASTGIFGSTITTTATSPFGTTPATSASGTGIFGTAAPSTAPSTGIFGSTTTSTSSPFGASLPTTSAAGTGIFGAATSTAAPSTTTTSPFGAVPVTPSGSGTGVFGSGFGATAPSTSTAGPFGSVFASSSSSSTAAAPSGSIFGGFGGSSTASASSPTTGGFSVNLSATSPTSSTAFGASPSFGSGFSGFNTQSKPSGATTGFSFGGFAGQSSSSGAPAPTFASFGSAATAAAQPTSSPFGGSMFGSAAPTQPSGFGGKLFAFGESFFLSTLENFLTIGSPFGGPSPAQSPTSSSFTSYRDRK
ncbi:unnamed protein product [Adineta ricciae]|uniref:Uncharacterized protein n=1 Tax=Adineta ricciae TaxID=249248 RepID=A0A813YKG8_ADIRI|nr:unnamed protein product [Adineta ricciae]